MPNFANVISLAYLRILARLPDPGGLDNFNRLMNTGTTEAMMREALLRSPEYAQKNPDAPAATGRVAGRARKKPAGTAGRSRRAR
jgi:hypothetical protein